MSPCNAKVKLVYPTGHAVGLETEDGTVILILAGIAYRKYEGRRL